MTDYLHLLPSISNTVLSPTAEPHEHARDRARTPKKRSSIGSSPAHTISKLISGANDFLSRCKNAESEQEQEENRRVEERKQILGLRMKNVSRSRKPRMQRTLSSLCPPRFSATSGTRDLELQTLTHTTSQATSVSQWTSAAQELDLLEGNHIWKSELEGVEGVYRPDVIRERMRELDEARTNCDIRRMVHLVRTALSRELGGMGNIDLYRHSYIGTKDLIELYVQSAVKTIEDLVEKSGYPGALPQDMGHHDILEAFLQARQSFGRSALLLSGGGTFGMMHAGVMEAMYEADLLPRIISGASAGSIVAAVFCTRTPDEIPEVIRSFPYGDLAVFEEDGKEESVLDHVKRLLTEGSWSDIKHLTRVMRNLLGDITFQEAYNRTRKICNISVSTESLYELPRLLNYITAPNVMMWSAVAASCSVPFVFTAAPLLIKDPQTGDHMPWNPTPQRWMDGSVDNDLPMTRLAEMFNVNHFIVSQVNPHVVPFLAKDDRLYSEHHGSRPEFFGASHNAKFTATLTTLAKDEALHRLQFLAELGIFPTVVTKLRSILSQKYSGDITILPEFDVHDLPRILKNPSVAFMERSTRSGQQATWPKLSRIRDRCAVELAIDRSIQVLRARCLFSQSQVNLRRMVTDAKSLGLKASFTHGLCRPYAVASSQTQTQALVDHVKLRRHSRRGSGGSLQMMARQRKNLMDDENAITDDDTEEEERLELGLRRGSTQVSQPGRGSAVVKPRMKRGVFRGLPTVSLSNLGSMTNPLPAYVSGDEGSEFDFSKPLRPPPVRAEKMSPARGPELSARSSRGLLRSPIILSRSSPQLNSTPSSRLEATSPTTGDLETPSELHTSDPDVDSHTDESVSDPDPYSQSPLPRDEETTTTRKENRSEDSLLDSEFAVADDGRRAKSPALADDEQETTDPGEGMWD